MADRRPATYEITFVSGQTVTLRGVSRIEQDDDTRRFVRPAQGTYTVVTRNVLSWALVREG